MLSILALIILLLLLKCTLVVSVHGEDIRIWVRILFIKIKVFPGKEKPKKIKKKPAKPSVPAPKQPTKPKPEPKKPLVDQITMVLEFLEPLPNLIKRMIRGVRITGLTIWIRVAESDAAQTAIQYGRTCAVVYGALATLRNIFKIQVQNITIQPDFVHENSSYKVDFKVHMRVYTALFAVLCYLLTYFKNTIKKNEETRSKSNA